MSVCVFGLRLQLFVSLILMIVKFDITYIYTYIISYTISCLVFLDYNCIRKREPFCLC